MRIRRTLEESALVTEVEKYKRLVRLPRFLHLLNLLIQAPDVTVLLCGPLVHLHGLHTRVVLCGQGLQDQIGVFVHTLGTKHEDFRFVSAQGLPKWLGDRCLQNERKDMRVGNTRIKEQADMLSDSAGRSADIQDQQ